MVHQAVCGFVGSSGWVTGATSQRTAAISTKRSRGYAAAKTITTAVMTPDAKEKMTLGEQINDLLDSSGTIRFAQSSVYDVQGEWARHRSGLRYIRHTLGLPTSQLLRRVAPICTFVGLESLAFSLYSHLTETAVPHFSTTPFSLMAGVVGLLLVFRTNSSYQRFVEGRIAWGTLVNRSRDLVRLTLVGLETDAQNQIVRYTGAFCICLKDHLRGATSDKVEESLKDLLNDKELKMVMESKHRPNAVAMLISAAIAADPSAERNIRVKLQDGVATLIDVLGISERILRTPIPLSYTRHTSRVCILWCTAMPLVLLRDLGDVGGAFASVVITFVLLGIEDIGVNIEDPFRVLPLDQLCNTINNNVFEIVKNRDQAVDCIKLTRDD